jgi:hypothetical protein
VKTLCLAFYLTALAASAADIESLLRRPIIGSNLPLSEVQAYTEARVPLMPVVDSVQQWEAIAEKLRCDVLDRVVFRGRAAEWRKQKTRVEWLETIKGGAGYNIRKLRYEAVPGLWIPALLYEPHDLAGKVPAVLNVNGHDGAGTAAAYKQIRCINQAKRGMLALNTEWLGMGQLRGSNYVHYRMNQLDLCGTSGLAVFYLAMQRALDVLLAHPNADSERVAVAGLSGGGWQTIFISSLDPRVKLSNPVAGYSSFRTRARFLQDLGDSEQTPCDLATVADYTHLTAMMTPRATLLTFNAKDNCCFGSEHALQPLMDAALPIFKLYGRADRLRAHVNHNPGDHNFGQDNREALYRMLGDVFNADDEMSPIEIPCEGEIKSNDVLRVDLPAGNADFNSLARRLAEALPRSAKVTRKANLQEARRQLREILRAKHSQVAAEKVSTDAIEGISAVLWRFRIDDAWTVPGIELSRGESTGTTILVGDNGRAKLGPVAEELLSAGQRVLAVDPFFFGESRIRSRDFLFALLVAAVGERPLGIQSGQIGSLARWAQSRYGSNVTVRAHGPRSSLYTLAAVALEETVKAELHDSLRSLKQVIDENWGVNQAPELFCFGLLESFDVDTLMALAGPERVSRLPKSPLAQRP